MTDKVNLEVESPISGRLVKVLASDGDLLPVGTTLAILADDSIVSSEVAVVKGQENHESTPVASTPAAKREAALHGIDLHSVIKAGAIPPLNRSDVIAYMTREGQLREAEVPVRPEVRATPVAQRIATEYQIDLISVAERKPGEKLKRADIENQLQEAAQTASEPVEAIPVVTAITPQDMPQEELVPLTPTRRLIGKRMLESVTTAPHIYLDLEIDMTEAERCRQSIGRSMEAQGEPALSLTALIVRATAAAIVLHPMVNAIFEEKALDGKDAIRQRQGVHIGIAVDTERTLLTPVIRNAHQLNIMAVSRELRRLTQAARQDTLVPDELAGATFTISNLGMYGIDTFHAIIVPGQSAILAVGKVTKRGVVVEDDNEARLEICPMMKVSLSADHRVLDGASGSRFLRQLKMFLENPYLLL
jgi:pyruvate/2-oxoglutarate dehydrogenase complex dihydrolipoamide acyltransferase (E2) component